MEGPPRVCKLRLPGGLRHVGIVRAERPDGRTLDAIARRQMTHASHLTRPRRRRRRRQSSVAGASAASALAASASALAASAVSGRPSPQGGLEGGMRGDFGMRGETA